MKKTCCLLLTLICLSFFTSCNTKTNDNSLNQALSLDDHELYKVIYLEDAFNSGVFSETWDNPTALPPEFFINFFGSKTGLSFLSTDEEEISIATDVVEAYLQNYFDVTPTFLQTSIFYNQSNNAYNIPIPAGGLGNIEILEVTKSDNSTTISFNIYFEESPQIGKVVIENSDSNHKVYKYTSFELENK